VLPSQLADASTQQQQEELSVIRVRAQLVKARTLLVNTARGAVKSLGVRLPATNADAFRRPPLPNKVRLGDSPTLLFKSILTQPYAVPYYSRVKHDIATISLELDDF
jgi:hypothetical protein